MCHEASGAALTETIGIGKGSVSLADVEQADLVVVVGQNPGTNHPRMLSALAEAKQRGAQIISVNPLPEAGLLRFKDPQTVRGVAGRGAELTDVFCQIRLGGDLAFFKAIGARLLDAEDAAPGTVLDREFIERHTHDFEAYRAQARALDEAEIAEATGLPSELLDDVARRFARAERIVLCWAMGLTQHKHSVPTIREAVNVMLLRGMIGKPGAGLCPVRGHSNVQGDRTMGIYEKMPDSFLDALDKEFGITTPREHGYDTVESIRAMSRGDARVFIGMGGNFARATPDTEVTEAALRSCSLTVQVSTKLNRSHVATGRTALILPTLGRTEVDEQASGKQFVTVEDSMSVVHRSRGRLRPASKALLSEVSIVCRLARATLGPDHPVPWRSSRPTRHHPRLHRAGRAGVRGLQRQVRRPNGFVARIRLATPGSSPPTPVSELRQPLVPEGAAGTVVAADVAQPRPVQHHHLQVVGPLPQYRERAACGDGRADDLAELGLQDGQRVDLVSSGRTSATTGGGPTISSSPIQRGAAAPTGDQPVGAVGFRCRCFEHPDLEVGGGSPRTEEVTVDHRES